MSEANYPAYPANPQVMIDAHSGGSWEMASLGLTKRERFAMAAMQGMISSGDMELAEDGVESFIAECSVKYADALLAELAKEK